MQINYYHVVAIQYAWLEYVQDPIILFPEIESQKPDPRQHKHTFKYLIN